MNLLSIRGKIGLKAPSDEQDSGRSETFWTNLFESKILDWLCTSTDVGTNFNRLQLYSALCSTPTTPNRRTIHQIKNQRFRDTVFRKIFGCPKKPVQPILTVQSSHLSLHAPTTSHHPLVQVLHEDAQLPVGVANLALHSLPLEYEGPDLDKVLVALHALVGPLLLGDVHAHAAAGVVNV